MAAILPLSQINHAGETQQASFSPPGGRAGPACFPYHMAQAFSFLFPLSREENKSNSPQNARHFFFSSLPLFLLSLFSFICGRQEIETGKEKQRRPSPMRAGNNNSPFFISHRTARSAMARLRGGGGEVVVVGWGWGW
ncbi:uncharacterized [Tachysurus ichikawai]